MLTLDADSEEVRKLTRKAIGSLNKNEFQGLIILIVGGRNVRTSTIWERVEPIFIQDEVYPYPTPHPDAFVEMGHIANERREKDED